MKPRNQGVYSLFFSSLLCFIMLSFSFKFSRFSKRKASIPFYASASSIKSTEKPMVPVTVLSGFLGAGKTTFLSHALANQSGKKIGLVVNDMATVNVDAKQIRSQTFDEIEGIDTMELQNGCVCCTLAEDLLASVSKLMSMSDLQNNRYDHIIVECSGIAEPRKIRDLFQQAEDMDMGLLKNLKLDTLITLVDSKAFLDLFGTDEEIMKKPELAYAEGADGTRFIDINSSQRKITELLLEQVECADILLLNKCDLLDNEDQINLVKKVVESINPTGAIYTCVKGEVENPLSLIGSIGGEGAANFGMLDEHRNLVKAVEQSHSHAHAHSDHGNEVCEDTACTDPTHNHDHSHQHDSTTVTCADTECKDPTHNHDHSHSHANANGEVCADTTCTDPTHNHDHSHDHVHDERDVTTAERRFGITSFVYKRRRPFHPIRFSVFLQGMGKVSMKGMSDFTSGAKKEPAAKEDAALIQARRALMRSKGFVWMATSGAAAYFMSHAGQYLELVVLGRWWADINEKEWPQGVEQEIKVDFDGPHGDRRQELVFIGQFGKDGSSSREALEKTLDSCLLTDSEMEQYELEAPKGDAALREYFVPDF